MRCNILRAVNMSNGTRLERREQPLDIFDHRPTSRSVLLRRIHTLDHRKTISCADKVVKTFPSRKGESAPDRHCFRHLWACDIWELVAARCYAVPRVIAHYNSSPHTLGGREQSRVDINHQIPSIGGDQDAAEEVSRLGLVQDWYICV